MTDFPTISSVLFPFLSETNHPIEGFGNICQRISLPLVQFLGFTCEISYKLLNLALSCNDAFLLVLNWNRLGISKRYCCQRDVAQVPFPKILHSPCDICQFRTPTVN